MMGLDTKEESSTFRFLAWQPGQMKESLMERQSQHSEGEMMNLVLNMYFGTIQYLCKKCIQVVRDRDLIKTKRLSVF